MIKISSRLEYDYLVTNGFVPLADWRKFHMCFKLRLSIQSELFGAADFQLQNQKFYQWSWDNKPHVCEETGKLLHNYSSVYVSHIISRGSDRRLAIDPRNVNILCFDMHQKWETFKNTEMNIYPTNQRIIQLLKSDYNCV